MKVFREWFVIQRTKPSGEWVDVAQYQTPTVAEADFRDWAKLNAHFFVKLIVRRVEEEELLLDHVDVREF